MDRMNVKVIGEMEDVLVHLSSNDKVCQFIDIVVADILEAYGRVLSRDWSEKLNGIFCLGLVTSVATVQRKPKSN